MTVPPAVEAIATQLAKHWPMGRNPLEHDCVQKVLDALSAAGYVITTKDSMRQAWIGSDTIGTEQAVSADPFSLDRTENPHPRMRDHALQLRHTANATNDPVIGAHWLGYMEAMCDAVLYLANPSTPKVRKAMSAGLLGCIDTPAQGNRRDPLWTWAADNGCFSERWKSAAWFGWLDCEHTASGQHSDDCGCCKWC